MQAKLHSELIIIKNEWGEKRDCVIAQLKFVINNGDPLVLTMVVVPHICDLVCLKPTDTSKTSYKDLSGLELAKCGHTGGRPRDKRSDWV